jgi:hypothetical protein
MIEFKDKFLRLNEISPIIYEYIVENSGEKGDFSNLLTIEELLNLRRILLNYGDLLDQWIEENKENWHGDVVDSFKFLDLCINANIQLNNMHFELDLRHGDYLKYLKKNNLTKFDFE